ncbi:DKNYY domain-containing protein [Spirosoma aerophilum]
MRLFHILLSIVGLGALVSCKKSAYETKNGLVYYKDKVINSADYSSFQPLNAVFAKDKNQGYYRGIPITGTVGTRFEALDEHYATDRRSVFYCDNYLDFKLFESSRKDKISQIANADARSFVVLKEEYANDKFRAYYKGVGFAVADVASFEPLDYMFARDKKVGYFSLKPIPGSEGRSFTVLSSNYAKDSHHVYHSRTIVDGVSIPEIHAIETAEPASFTVIDLYHGVDKNHAYFRDKQLEDADPTSFKKWDAYSIDYSTDTTHVYFRDKLIRDAHKPLFKLMTESYAQDGQTVFYEDKPLKNADLTSFTVLESGYAKDAKQVFYAGKVLTHAHPASFTLIANEAGRDAADKTHSYHQGQRVRLDD